MRLRIVLTIGLLLGHTIVWLGLPTQVGAASHSLLISEVQMAGVGSGHASEEFIELYNASSIPQNVDKFTLKYHAVSTTECASSWQTKYTFGATTIPAFSYWLVAANGYMTTADGRFTPGLASTGGAIRLYDAGGLVVDTLGWGNTNTCAEDSPIAAVKDGASLERRPGDDNPLAGNGIDTDSNTGDFIYRLVPEPQSSLDSPEDAVLSSEQSTAQLIPTYLPLEITELLVDPVSPQTDAMNEYIELYNPNTEPVQVANYELSAGTNRYHLAPTIMPAESYLMITSQISRIALTNSGGQLSLKDPTGELLDITAPWPVAEPGATWSLFEDGWRWSATASPAATNIRDDLEAIDQTSANTTVDYPVILLTEMLPNPLTPNTDANDEFIELYNPNNQDVDLKGYMLKTGSSLGNSYIFSTRLIPAGSWIVITSSESPLTLANDGSKIALYDPNGVTLDTTTYATAPEGESWALIEGNWVWTTSTTPATENVATVALISNPTAKKVKSIKKKTVKAVASKKVTAKKTATPKTPQGGNVLGSTNAPVNNPWLLFVLAGLTICYIIYEFRYDIRNYYYRLRGHQGPGSQTRP